MQETMRVEAAGGVGEGQGEGAPRSRIDHRTGRRVYQQDESYWAEQERRWRQSGQSRREYCEANGLAISTLPMRTAFLPMPTG